MKPPLRIALIGVGGVGKSHLAAIESFAREDRARLVAVADPTLDRLPETKAALEAQGVRRYSRHEDLLHSEETLDAVTIAAPIPCHFEMARACIRQGLYINLEKPPVPCLHQLETLIEEDRNERVSVGFQMIVSKPIQRLKQMVVQGEMGEILEIRAAGCWPRVASYYERAPWAGKMALRGEPVFDGPATNALAHVIHNIMYLAGTSVESFEVPVSAQGELYRARPIQSYDVACVRGSLRSGALYTAALTHATEREMPFQIELHGSKGWGRLSDNGARLATSQGISLEGTESFSDGLKRYYRRFFEFAAGERKRADTHLRDARGYLIATNGMLLSSGGVHDIGENWVAAYGEGNDCGYSVAGLREAAKASLDSGKLFAEMSVPWAVSTKSVSADDISANQFARLSRSAGSQDDE